MRGGILEANAYTPTAAVPSDTAALIARRERVLPASYRLFYRNPVHLVHGQGVQVYDADGREYLDVYNNVAGVGHAHPRVTAAIAQQSALLGTHTRYLSEPIVTYAEELLRTLTAPVEQIMFCCTGSEANDLAVRVAGAYTGGSGIIVTEHAYHGNTALVTNLSPALCTDTTPDRSVWRIASPETARHAPEQLEALFATEVRRCLAEMAAARVRPSVLLVDSIFSSDGIHAAPRGFLQEAVTIFRDAGGLCIADEVQPGFGRTGDGMWGFTRHNLAPDIVTMGKPMGNGIPIAAVAATRPIFEAFAAHSPYFNTFGGNNIAIAAAQAVLDVIREERLIDHAREVGTYFRAQLRTLADGDPRLGQVRGTGLYIGLEIVADDAPRTPDGATAADIVNALRDRGVLTSLCGSRNNVLKLRPPLPFAARDVDRFITELDATLRCDVPVE